VLLVVLEMRMTVEGQVHHLTLLDVDARGYVRPICISYLTRERPKIMRHFADLSSEFALAAETLKRANYQLFRVDVERRIADLMHTRAHLDSAQTESLLTIDEQLAELTGVRDRLADVLTGSDERVNDAAAARAADATVAMSSATAAVGDTSASSAAAAAAAAGGGGGAHAHALSVARKTSFAERLGALDLYGDADDIDVSAIDAHAHAADWVTHSASSASLLTSSGAVLRRSAVLRESAAAETSAAAAVTAPTDVGVVAYTPRVLTVLTRLDRFEVCEEVLIMRRRT
jgi:hypothetical protein